jgi:hypothetical protein
MYGSYSKSVFIFPLSLVSLSQIFEQLKVRVTINERSLFTPFTRPTKVSNLGKYASVCTIIFLKKTLRNEVNFNKCALILFTLVAFNFFHSTAHIGFLKRHLLRCNAVWSVGSQQPSRTNMCWRLSQAINQHERGSTQSSACCLLHKTVLPVTRTVDENVERDPCTYKLPADVCVSFSFWLQQ